MATRPVPKTLLIVDDDEALSQLLAWTFEDLGYTVWRAADCDQAAESARAISFDFALIDFHLPDGDGHSLSRRLQEILPTLQIVSMSADRTGATARGGNTPARAFVEKPVPPARVHHIFSTLAASAGSALRPKRAS